jgi:hypothetical protein
MPSIDDFLKAGVTYRQLDFWTTKGYLRAMTAQPGTGRSREWLLGEERVAATMVRLVDAGLTVQAAAQVARQPLGGPVELAPGVVISVGNQVATVVA